jgi:NACHT domain/Short NACHT-associated C-Terminal domain, family 5
MSDTTEIIKTVAPIAAPFVAAIVETFVKPKLQKLSKFFKKEEASNIFSLESRFQEYLERSYENHSYVNVLAFQNQQKILSEIYIPLIVVNENSKAAFLLDKYKRDFIPQYKKVLVSDTAGMGKSTLMKHLFLSSIEKNQGIPIFIEMRKLKGDVSIFNHILNDLNPIDDEFDEDFIRRLIKEGNFIFFFDGYDEIPLSQRDDVVSNLNDFISKTGNNLFIITSRPESSLASFPDFMNFNIQPLELEQSFELLKKYDNSGEISTEIISKLEGETLESIEEFLTNPLLVSLLYKSYEYKRKIPLKKHLFYRQVFDSLYENHDLTKNPPLIRPKFSNLEIDDFHRVMRALGFITMKLGEIEYDKDTILSLIKQSKERCVGLDFKESDFLKDLLSIVPLFNRDGGYYKWSHKSLQDYFAAQFIWHDAEENKAEILRKIVRSDDNEKYFNVLDLYYDIDYKTFRHVVIYDFLCSLINHYELPYVIETNQSIDEKGIKFYKLLSFIGTHILIFNPNFLKEHDKEHNWDKKYIADKYLSEKNITVEEPLTRVSNDYFYFFANSNYSFLVILSKLLGMKNEEYFSEKVVSDLSVREYDNVFSNLSVIFVSEKLLKIDEVKIAPIKVLTHLFNVRQSFDDMLDWDINKCRKMKAEIEAEIEREKSSDLFDNF